MTRRRYNPIQASLPYYDLGERHARQDHAQDGWLSTGRKAELFKIELASPVTTHGFHSSERSARRDSYDDMPRVKLPRARSINPEFVDAMRQYIRGYYNTALRLMNGNPDLLLFDRPQRRNSRARPLRLGARRGPRRLGSRTGSGLGSSTGSRVRNPQEAAYAKYEEFHGKPASHVDEYEESYHYHENLAELGKLVNLKIVTIFGKKITFKWDRPDGTRPVLCSSENGRQLFIIGGDQSIDLNEIGMGEDSLLRDQMILGVIHELTYETEKGMDNFKAIHYYHEVGEESGVQPFLTYNTIDGSMEIWGGKYEVRPEGIVD